MSDIHAMRMKRLDEMEAAARKYGTSQVFMQMSALSPATRKSHADRHGKFFTAQQLREFWSDPANAEGCKCTVVSILLGDDGKPLVPSIVERARRNYEVMAAKGYEWSK